MTILRRLIGTFFLVGVSFSAAAQSAREPKAFVEIFTAEGCADCIPAETLVDDFSAMPGVYPVGFHVSIWDYLGWNDSAARHEFTARQRDYARRDRLQVIYTPQFVVNGRIVGNKPEMVRAAVANAAPMPVSLSVIRSGMEVEVLVTTNTPQPAATLSMIPVISDYEVAPTGGDMEGQTLKFRETAAALVEIGDWDGITATRFTAPAPKRPAIFMLQELPLGRVIGLARIEGTS